MAHWRTAGTIGVPLTVPRMLIQQPQKHPPSNQNMRLYDPRMLQF